MDKYVILIFVLSVILIVLFAFIYKAIYTKKINRRLKIKTGMKLLNPLSSTIIFSLIVISLAFLSLSIIFKSKLNSNPIDLKTPVFGAVEYVLDDIENNSIYAIYVPILKEHGEIPGYTKEVDISNVTYRVTIYYELTSNLNQKDFIILLEYYGDDKSYDKTEIGLLYKYKDEYFNESVIIEKTNNYVFFGYCTDDIDLKIIYNQLRVRDTENDYEIVDSLEKEVSFVYESKSK